MPITLVEEYNPAWRHWFQDIIRYLDDDVAARSLRIEHVGSTAIPGMVAKPVIDLVIVTEPGTFPVIRDLLENRGYRWEGDKGLPGRESFTLADETLQKSLPEHHLYVCEEGTHELRKHVAFREYLKRNKVEAEHLSNLKHQLAEMYDNDRQLYIAGKDAMVREITEKALDWWRDFNASEEQDSVP